MHVANTVKQLAMFPNVRKAGPHFRYAGVGDFECTFVLAYAVEKIPCLPRTSVRSQHMSPLRGCRREPFGKAALAPGLTYAGPSTLRGLTKCEIRPLRKNLCAKTLGGNYCPLFSPSLYMYLIEGL